MSFRSANNLSEYALISFNYSLSDYYCKATIMGMEELSIGFFDSGIGGLNYLREFEMSTTFPHIKTVYHCDQKNAPFGSKSPNEILRLTIQGVEYLFQKGCHLVILACNTASVRSIRYIQQSWLPKSLYRQHYKVLGISTPFLEYTQQFVNKDEKTLLIGTQSTIQSGFYQENLSKMQYNLIDYLELPKLATIIENQSKLSTTITRCTSVINDDVTEYVQETLLNSGFNRHDYKNIILACTHYHNVEGLLGDVFYGAVIHNHMNFCARMLDTYIARHQHELWIG